MYQLLIFFFLLTGHITLNGCILYSLYLFFIADGYLFFFFFQFGAILCTTAYEHLCKVLCGYVFNYLEHSTILMLTVQSQVVSFIRLKVQSSQDCPQPAVN